jgi:hypothetical protein
MTSEQFTEFIFSLIPHMYQICSVDSSIFQRFEREILHEAATVTRVSSIICAPYNNFLSTLTGKPRERVKEAIKAAASKHATGKLPAFDRTRLAVNGVYQDVRLSGFNVVEDRAIAENEVIFDQAPAATAVAAIQQAPKRIKISDVMALSRPAAAPGEGEVSDEDDEGADEDGVDAHLEPVPEALLTDEVLNSFVSFFTVDGKLNFGAKYLERRQVPPLDTSTPEPRSCPLSRGTRDAASRPGAPLRWSARLLNFLLQACS